HTSAKRDWSSDVCSFYLNVMTGYSGVYITVALITLITTIIVSVFFKGFLSIIPVLIGIIVGYISSLLYGIVDLEPIAKAKWLQLPDIYMPFHDYTPSLQWGLILIMLPIVFVTVSEHIG